MNITVDRGFVLFYLIAFLILLVSCFFWYFEYKKLVEKTLWVKQIFHDTTLSDLEAIREVEKLLFEKELKNVYGKDWDKK